MKRFWLLAVGLFCSAQLLPAAAAVDVHDDSSLRRTFDRWNEPVAPFRVIGNVYFVGMQNISSFLITGDEGHVLIDTGFSNSVPIIRSNILKMGFSPGDIKYILSSHAHCDHVAGHAAMKRMTGAKIGISEADAVLLKSGGAKDFLFGDSQIMHFEGIAPDLVLKNGDQIRLGKIILTAHLTPGHTPGCTTWTMPIEENGRQLNVLFFGSTSINPGTKLVKNRAYPTIVEDIQSTYQKLRKLPCDVFLAPHPGQFRMAEKFARLDVGGANPFIDPEGFRTFLDEAEGGFKKELEKQLVDAKGQ